MITIKRVMIRSMMLFLFFGALTSTFQAISGVEVQSVISSIYKNIKNDPALVYIHKKIALVGTSFPLIEKTSTSKLKSDFPETTSLENKFDWTQYPMKKVIATGYTAGYESTGKNPNHPDYGITYSGVMVKRDLFSTVAADLNIFPIGTILFIPGYGFGVVADKGGAIKGNRVDLYYETVEDVYNEWGKKELDVYVIEMGKGKLTEDKLKQLNEDKSMQVFRQKYMNPIQE